jgi:hypothetical protein
MNNMRTPPEHPQKIYLGLNKKDSKTEPKLIGTLRNT